MAGPSALIRLLHSGVQDTRLLPPKGQPNIDMFTKVFVRSGRFTTQWVRLDFDTIPNLNTTCTLTIPRKGHLVTRLYLVTTMPDIATIQLQAQAAGGSNFAGPYFGWTNSIGHALINQTTITIGGAKVERLDGTIMEIMDEFYNPLEKQNSMNKLIHRKDNGFSSKSFGITDENPSVIVTPLPFWFSCGDSGLALPIDAIQADLVQLSVSFNPINNLYVSSQLQQLPSGTPVAGDAYFPLSNSPFYIYDAINGSNVYGFSSPVSQIPNITMSNTFNLGQTYVLAEYVYLDKPEANRFRLSDIKIPIVQHYNFDPVDTQGLNRLNYKFSVPNPTRNLFFYMNRFEALRYNATFLASRDLSGNGTSIPWWPDASGLEDPQILGTVRSAFSTRDSEPLNSIALQYEGKLIRYLTDCPSLFRSVIPSLEMKKSPWVNRYYYTLAFGLQHGLLPPSLPSGEANLDKMLNIELQLMLHPNTGSLNVNNVPRYYMYLYAETYNILRVFGGRAGLLFAY
jgi:Major capsid protein N-terminus